MLRIAVNVSNGAAKSGLERDSRRGKILSAVTKYLVSGKQIVSKEPVRWCCEWQVGQLRVVC